MVKTVGTSWRQKYYLDYGSFLLVYLPYYQVEVEKLSNHSYLFFRKEMRYYSRRVKFYQSIPVKMNDSAVVSCSLLFAIYRKCKFLRLFVGDRLDYEMLIKSCHSSEMLRT